LLKEFLTVMTPTFLYCCHYHKHNSDHISTVFYQRLFDLWIGYFPWELKKKKQQLLSTFADENEEQRNWGKYLIGHIKLNLKTAQLGMNQGDGLRSILVWGSSNMKVTEDISIRITKLCAARSFLRRWQSLS
jgi:hypothetical protein